MRVARAVNARRPLTYHASLADSTILIDPCFVNELRR